MDVMKTKCKIRTVLLLMLIGMIAILFESCGRTIAKGNDKAEEDSAAITSYSENEGLNTRIYNDGAAFDLKGRVKKIDLYEDGINMYKTKTFTTNLKINLIDDKELNGNDRVSEKVAMGRLGIKETILIKRNEKGLISGIEKKTMEGVSKEQFVYSPDGKLMKYVNIGSGEKYITEYTYNGGAIVEAKETLEYMGEGQLPIVTYYKYNITITDKQGNWIKRTRVDSRGDAVVEARKIEYYN